MLTQNEMIIVLASDFNNMLRSHVALTETPDEPIIKQPDVQDAGDKIYAMCLHDPELIPAFEHELSTYGYTFSWLKDNFKPYNTFFVGINTPYGMVTLYTDPNAFQDMGKEINDNRDLIERHQKAEAAGDEAEMAAVTKEFARRLRRKQILYFLLSPIHALLLGVRGFLRLFKR